MHGKLSRTADNGRSFWIWIPKIYLPTTSEGVNIDEFEVLLESGSVCIEISLQDVEFHDCPLPAKSSCLLSDQRVLTHTSIVPRPVFLETFKFNRHYDIPTVTETAVEISLLTDCRW